MYKIVGADGKEYGPVGPEVVRDWIKQGRANGQTMVQGEGGAWQPLGTFPEFADALASGPPSLPPINAGRSAPSQDIPNYLWQSIAVTLCCCLPTGIAGIYYATQVNKQVTAGDYPAAQRSSESAKKWVYISVGLGIVMNIAPLIYYLVARPQF